VAKHNRKSFRFIGTARGSQIPSTANGPKDKIKDQGGPNKRTMQRRFASAWPYRVGSGVNWFGNDRFWTLLPADATWGRGEKIFWFRQEWGYYGPRPWDTGKGRWQVDGYGTQAGCPGTARCDLESQQFVPRTETGRPS